MFANPGNSTAKRFLTFCSLLVCTAGLVTWLLPGRFVLDTPAGQLEVFLLLVSVYPLLLMSVGLYLTGAPGRYLFNLLLIIGIAACLLHLVVYVLLLLPNHTLVWDDALMFMRYVSNLRLHGSVSWNVADGATYGSTELLYLCLLWFISLFTGLDAPHLTLQLAGCLSGSAFLLLIGVMVWRVVKLNFTGKLLVLLVLFFGLAWHIPSLNRHFITGMGTTFTLAYLMVYLILLHDFEPSSGKWRLIVTGIWGGMAFFARPDLMVFGTVIPLLVFIFAPNRASRRRAFYLGSVTLVVILAQLLFAQIIFGSMLPLSFYVKSTQLYGDSNIYHDYAKLPAEQLHIFAQNNLFYGLLLLPCVLFPVRTLRQWGAVGIGAGFAAVLFVLYYRFFVMQIMYFFQRFYYPVLPVLLYLTAVSLSVLLNELPRRLPIFARMTGLICATLTSLILVGGLLYYPAEFLRQAQAAFHPHRNILYQPSRAEFGIHWSRHMFEIWSFSRISPELVMATTEVGVPAVVNPDWYIYDLSGLNMTRLALTGFSADDFFASQPDLIYMPWTEYTDMLNAMRNHPVFQADYEVYTGPELTAPFDIAIRKSSPYYQRLKHSIILGIQKRLPKSTYPD